MENIDIKTILTIISTILGIISALISKLFLDKLQKIEDNKNKLKLITDKNNIEDKLKTFYIPIYIKLFIISLTKKQIKLLKQKSYNDYLLIEKNTILKIHNEIINIITLHYGLDNEYDIHILIIKNYINYVITYNNLRSMKSTLKPSDIEIKFPKEFLIEIEKKIIELQKKYDIFLDKYTKKLSLKEKIYNFLCYLFRFCYKSKLNDKQNNNIIYDNKWSINDYIKNNININEINKIIIDDTESFDSLYNKIDLNEILLKLKLNKELNNDDTIIDIPIEK